ncbi:MAG: hypothetical protein NBV68_07570 [Erythrobacter sp.]|nr:hypothetical protein [Erythrobacter sp.]MCL9999224.1 hypothetical protein [Erythrobacter sp.]
MGQDEEAATPVRSAHFSRCEQARFCAVAQPLKAAGDLGKSQIDVPFDVLGEDDAGAHLADDPLDLGPQVAGIGLAPALSGEAEGLAGITGREDMNAIAPRAAVEGSQIVPYRRAIQPRVFHPCHESGRSMGFPLDETCSAISGLGDGEPEFEPAISGAQGKAVEQLLRAWGGT